MVLYCQWWSDGWDRALAHDDICIWHGSLLPLPLNYKCKPFAKKWYCCHPQEYESSCPLLPSGIEPSSGELCLRVGTFQDLHQLVVICPILSLLRLGTSRRFQIIQRKKRSLCLTLCARCLWNPTSMSGRRPSGVSYAPTSELAWSMHVTEKSAGNWFLSKFWEA